jgi:hypothetical protein
MVQVALLGKCRALSSGSSTDNEQTNKQTQINKGKKGCGVLELFHTCRKKYKFVLLCQVVLHFLLEDAVHCPTHCLLLFCLGMKCTHPQKAHVLSSNH